MGDHVNQDRATVRCRRATVVGLLSLLFLPACGDRAVASGQDASDGDQSSYSCGKPDVIARLSTCRLATSKSTCVSAGGTWTRGGLGNRELCFCPTGQEGCACTSHKQCVTGCRGKVPGGGGSCANVGFTCSPVTPEFGCICVTNPDGTIGRLCID
jgi:hypothetical protein